MTAKFNKLDNLTRWINKYRPWVFKDKINKNEANNNFLIKKNQFHFTFMSYNILSEDNLLRYKNYLYSHCSDHLLKCPERGERILQEIEINKPDILCLQEVYFDHYREFYSPELQTKGYEAIYNQREYRKDGCAIFYKKSKFNLLKTRQVNYHREDLARILDKPNVGLIAMLEPIGNESEPIDNRLVVGNTHILFNPKRQDIKLAQVRLLLAEMERMALRQIDEKGLKEYYPLLIAGDFNLLPYSPIYQFLTKGFLDWNNMDFHRLYGCFIHFKKTIDSEKIKIKTVSSNTVFIKEDDEDTKLKSDSNDQANKQAITHNLNLRSVFRASDRNNRKLVTCKNSRACELVDYIFYNQSKELNLVGFRKLLNEDLIRRQTPYLPNDLNGSDHFSIIAKFSLDNKSSE